MRTGEGSRNRRPFQLTALIGFAKSIAALCAAEAGSLFAHVLKYRGMNLHQTNIKTYKKKKRTRFVADSPRRSADGGTLLMGHYRIVERSTEFFGKVRLDNRLALVEFRFTHVPRMN